MPQSVLQGRVAIVTGGARGLGLAMVQALLRAGGRVVVVDLPSAHDEQAALVEWAQSIDHGTRLLAVQGDVRRGDDCAHVVAETMRHFGALHGVVNNAGIGPASINPMFQHDPVPFHHVSEQKWRDAVDVNLTGAFLMARAAMPSLLASGAGRVVNISTSYYSMTAAGMTPYAATKAAIEASSLVWSKDMAGTGVTVNVLMPGGGADTRMVPHSMRPDRENLIRPEAMQAPIVWLISRASDGVTGRRFSAKEWDAALPAEVAAEKAGAPVFYT